MLEGEIDTVVVYPNRTTGSVFRARTENISGGNLGSGSYGKGKREKKTTKNTDKTRQRKKPDLTVITSQSRDHHGVGAPPRWYSTKPKSY